MNQFLGYVLVVGFTFAGLGCARFPGGFARDCRTNSRAIEGGYAGAPLERLGFVRSGNLIDFLSDRNSAGTASDNSSPVTLSWARPGVLRVQASEGGNPDDHFEITGRMRRGLFVFKNEIDRDGIPWIWGGIYYDQAALGKTDEGNLVVVVRNGGWSGLLFLRFGMVMQGSCEFESLNHSGD